MVEKMVIFDFLIGPHIELKLSEKGKTKYQQPTTFL